GADRARGVNVDRDAARLDVLDRDERVRSRMPAALAEEVDAVEDLHRLMRVHRRHDLGDRVEVPVDERAEAPVVVDRTGARAARDEELEARDAEGVLDVDEDEADTECVLVRRPQTLLRGPVPRIGGPLLVLDAPDVADAIGL